MVGIPPGSTRPTREQRLHETLLLPRLLLPKRAEDDGGRDGFSGVAIGLGEQGRAGQRCCSPPHTWHRDGHPSRGCDLFYETNSIVGKTVLCKLWGASRHREEVWWCPIACKVPFSHRFPVKEATFTSLAPASQPPLTCERLLQGPTENLQLLLADAAAGAEQAGHEAHGGGDLGHHLRPAAATAPAPALHLAPAVRGPFKARRAEGGRTSEEAPLAAAASLAGQPCRQPLVRCPRVTLAPRSAPIGEACRVCKFDVTSAGWKE